MIDDDDGEVDALESVVCASEVVWDQPDISKSNATEGEAVVVASPAVITMLLLLHLKLCRTNLVFDRGSRYSS